MNTRSHHSVVEAMLRVSSTLGAFATPSLRTKMVIAFLAVALIPLGVLVFLNNHATQTALTDNANQALLAAASQTALNLDAFVNTNLDAIRTEAQMPVLARYLSLPANQRVDSIEEKEATATLHTLSRKDLVYVSSYALLDRQGQNVVDTSVGTRLDESDRDYFRVPFQTGLPYVSPARFFQTTGEVISIYFSSPVRNSAGDIVGVLRVSYSATILQRLLAQNNDLAGKQSFGILLDENHMILAHGAMPELAFKSVAPLDPARAADLQAAGRLPHQPLAELSANLPGLEQGLANVAAQPFFTSEAHIAGAGLEQSAVTTLKTQPWLIVFSQPRSVFLAPMETQTRNALLLAVVIASMAAAAAIVVARLLAAPIIHLTGIAQQVTAGDWAVQASVETKDEIGTLAQAFNGMTTQLRGLIGSLEQRVQERTAELTQRGQELEQINRNWQVTSQQAERRAMQLAASAQAARAIGQVRDIDQLLAQVSQIISAAFGHYHIGIFITDEIGRFAVLRAANSEGGQRMLERNYKLPLDTTNVIGRVIRTGQPYTVMDINSEADYDYVDSADLPNTRSKAVCPLRMGQQVFGALDVHSAQAAAFAEEDIMALGSLADQIAIAIENARLFTQTQTALQEAEETQRRYMQEQWGTLLPTLRTSGYEYHASGLPAIGDSSTPEIEQALRQGDIALSQAGAVEVSPAMAVPIKLRDEIIGVIDLQDINIEREWTKDDVAFVIAVADQAALALENARLFMQTQQRARREQLIAQIAAKMRAAPDTEGVMRTAVQEIRRALGASHGVIRLGTEMQDD